MKNKKSGFTKILRDPITMIMIALVVVLILTWIPHNPYDGEFANNDLISKTGSYGFLDIPIIIFEGYRQMFSIFIYVISAGIVFSILNKFGAIDVIIDDLYKGTNGNKYIFTSLIFSLIFLLSSLIGFFEQFLLLLPVIWISFGKVNINKKSSTIIFVLSASFGRAFSTTSPYAFVTGLDSIPDEIINTYYGGSISNMTGLIFLIMLLGLIFALVSINLYLFLLKDENNQTSINEENLSNIDNSNNKFSRRTIYISWILFLSMLTLIFICSLNWEQIMGDSYGVIANTLSNLFIIGATIKPMDQWGNIEKITILLSFSIIIYSVFYFSNSVRKDDDGIVIPVITKMIKVYTVFSISKSISLLLTYSGLASEIVSMIIWENSPALFLMALIPILLPTSFVMNSQSGIMVIFTPVIAEIIGQSGFDNPNLILVLSMSLMTLCIGINSAITPTQSLNSISIQESEIGYTEYIKSSAPILLSLLIAFSIIILPAIAMVV